MGADSVGWALEVTIEAFNTEFVILNTLVFGVAPLGIFRAAFFNSQTFVIEDFAFSETIQTAFWMVNWGIVFNTFFVFIIDFTKANVILFSISSAACFVLSAPVYEWAEMFWFSAAFRLAVSITIDQWGFTTEISFGDAFIIGGILVVVGAPLISWL